MRFAFTTTDDYKLLKSNIFQTSRLRDRRPFCRGHFGRAKEWRRLRRAGRRALRRWRRPVTVQSTGRAVCACCLRSTDWLWRWMAIISPPTDDGRRWTSEIRGILLVFYQIILIKLERLEIEIRWWNWNVEEYKKCNLLQCHFNLPPDFVQ